MQEKTLPKPKIRTSNIHSSEFGSVSYDIFGSPYQKLGSFLADDSLDFGYLGKPYNADTELYDYGFRDYSPNIARFTSVDPIRDGRNWFSYVVNDPVNYVDLWGLQCQSGSDRPIYYDNYGNPSYDPHVVTGRNLGEDIPKNPADVLLNSAEAYYQMQIPYEENNSCDEFLATILINGNIDPQKYHLGNTVETVKQHIEDLKSTGKDCSSPKIGANIVFMGDGNSPKTKDHEHSGILFLSEDGSIIYYDNSRNNPNRLPVKEIYSSLEAFEKTYYLYDSFYYQHITE